MIILPFNKGNKLSEVRTMRLINEKTKDAFSIHFHANNKKPAYFDTSEVKREGTLDGKKATFVCHPKRETSNRVNFILKAKDAKGEIVEVNVAVDNEKLRKSFADSKYPMAFVTSTERAAKPEKAEPKAKEGAKAPTQAAAKA